MSQTDPPSRLMTAFVDYLQSRPGDVDLDSTREFNQGRGGFEGVRVESTDMGGVPALTAQPMASDTDRTVLYFHGGGYVSGSPPQRYLLLAAALSLAADARVHLVDYRLAPEVRFPGAFDDCLTTYDWLLTDGGQDPATLAVLGDSAGGNLALAVLVAARRRGLPMPASVAALSPFADLTFSGDSLSTRQHLDPFVTRELLEGMATDYLDGADPADPRGSAVFADLTGLPPLLILVGENEILHDDATRIRDAAHRGGVDATFESWFAGIHVWPVFISAGLPESAAAVERLADFYDRHWPPADDAAPPNPDWTVEHRIADALRAAPPHIAAIATVVDRDMTTVLRPGSPDWTCVPSRPGSPWPNPMCGDPATMQWFRELRAGTSPTIDRIGISYMLMGEAGADFENPAATTPPDGADWYRVGPHLMVVFPGSAGDLTHGIAHDTSTGMPYVRPFPHAQPLLVIPIALPEQRISWSTDTDTGSGTRHVGR
jgi:acetyl esterase/lipase